MGEIVLQPHHPHRWDYFRSGPNPCGPNKQQQRGHRRQNGNGPQSRVRTGSSNDATSTNAHGRKLTVREEHETSMLTTCLITSGNLLFCLYHVLTRVRKHGGTLVIAMMLTSNCAQARPTPNLRPSRTGEEFGLNHRFTAYDCDHPTAVQALQLPGHCLTPKTDKDDANQTMKLLTQDKDRYQILQKATYYEFDAHQCIQTRSRFFYNCVWASHSVISRVPDTAQVVPPTIDFCRQAVRTQSYVKLTGESVALKNDGLPTYIKEVIRGELNVAQGTVDCLGEESRNLRESCSNKVWSYKKLISRYGKLRSERTLTVEI